MIQIRRGVFETNSSSTHSIAIPKPANRTYPKSVHFTSGRFGWEFEEHVNPANYLYTAVLDRPDTEEKIKHIKNVLDKHGIGYTFDPPRFSEDGWRLYGIDSPACLKDFLEAVFKNEYSLLDFIFYGIVVTGNDNGAYNIELEPYLHRMNKTYEDWGEEVPNPYYKEEYEGYDWYLKLN